MEKFTALDLKMAQSGCGNIKLERLTGCGRIIQLNKSRAHVYYSRQIFNDES